MWAALVTAAVAVAYGPVYGAGFIWDDDGYLTRPGLRSLRGLATIWSNPRSTEQYYPALHSAFWLEHRLWADAPLGYHLVNVILHALSACLFGLVLRKILSDRPILGPWLAALLFALHPVCVESVAWVSEQKNTLSLAFYLLAALAYLRFRERPSPGGYLVATLLFVLALLSKTVTATLPGALLVVAWWRQGRLSWRRDIRPLVPWLLLGAAGGLFTGWIERVSIGAQGADFDLGAAGRLVLAGRVVWFYLGKLLWPARLIFIYPRWTIEAGNPGQWIPLVLAVVATAGLAGLALRPGQVGRPVRAILAAWLFFTGSLFPTSGLFNVYGFLFSYVADHWQYLPSLGIFALAGGAIAAAAARAPVWLRRAVPVGVALVLLPLTWRQAGLYRRIETFYARTLAENPGAWMAHVNLGLIELGAGREAAAQGHFVEAIRLRPSSPEAHNDYGVTLVDAGRLNEGVEQYDEALRLRPQYVEAHNNLGIALAREGRMDEAIDQFRQTLRLNPDFAEGHNNLGLALAKGGHPAEAEAEFRSAIRCDPREFKAYNNLGSVLAGTRRFDEARRQIETAISLAPGFAEARFNLGCLELAEGHPAAAVEPLERAVELDPRYPRAEQALAYALQAVGRQAEAEHHWAQAVREGAAP